jgi:hypothetical protein
MAGKTRRIKKGGSPCLFILEDVLASISKLVKNIQKISDKKEVEKKREIKQSFTRDIYIVFMSQINASCSDIKPKKYEEFLKKIGNLNPYALDYPVCLTSQQRAMRAFVYGSDAYEPCEDDFSTNYLKIFW